MNLIYSPQAVADLRRLRAFIAEKDPAAAARIAADLISRLEHLRAFPDMGRAVAQAPDPAVVRDVVFGRHVIRYSILEGALVILRIWHHAENR